MSAMSVLYMEGNSRHEKNTVQGIQHLEKIAELGNIEIYWLIAFHPWKSNDIEDSILNFRKGASHLRLRQVPRSNAIILYKSGFITKAEYLFTRLLSGHTRQ